MSASSSWLWRRHRSCLQSNRKHSSHLLPSPTPVSHLLLSPQQEHLWPLDTQMATRPTIWSRIHTSKTTLWNCEDFRIRVMGGSRLWKIRAHWSDCGFLEAMCTPEDTPLLGIRGGAGDAWQSLHGVRRKPSKDAEYVCHEAEVWMLNGNLQLPRLQGLEERWSAREWT